MRYDYLRQVAALWLLLLTVKASADNFAVLFVAYDQGESNAFIQLEKALQESRVSYRILALGRAEEIFANHPLKLSLSTSLPGSLKTDRTKALPDQAMKELQDRHHFQLVYSGMASVAQAQVLNVANSAGAVTLALYDNFEPVQLKDYVRPFLSRLSRVDQFHVPSRLTAESFSQLSEDKSASIVVTGQPALESWDQVYKKTDRQSLLSNLNLPKTKKIVLFAGGYDSTYPTYLHTFIEGCKQATEYQCLITYHPKTDGSFERQEVTNAKADNLKVVSASRFSTAQLSTIADLVAVHKSSIATMAAYKGKPVLYVAEPEFSSFLIPLNLAQRATTPEQVVSAFQTLTEQPQPNSVALFPDRKASQCIARIIKQLLYQRTQ